LHGILGESDPWKAYKDQKCGDKKFHLAGSRSVRTDCAP
jgi:hypothetical protein